jgi:acyl-CoA dehydrogenase
MDFELTVEQKQLKKTVREFLKKEVAPLVNEYEGKNQAFPAEVIRDLVKKLMPFGYINGLIPEAEGGAGLDFLSYGLLIEELARVSASLALFEIGQSIVTRYTMYKLGSQKLKSRYWDRLMAGEILGAHALTEPDVGSGARDIKTTAVLKGDEYVINGTKCWSTAGELADILWVTVVAFNEKGEKGYTTFLVDKAQSKVTTSIYHKVGTCGVNSVEIAFDDCRVPKDHILGYFGHGLDAALDLIGLGRLSCSTISVGIAEAALEKAIEYAQQRKQFGRSIGRFQLVQEMIADMATEIECARFLSYRGWDSLVKGQGSPGIFSMAKYYSTEMGIRVTSKAIEIHGAYGLSKDYPVERYFRDARCMTFPDATSEIQKLIVARELLGMPAFV